MTNFSSPEETTSKLGVNNSDVESSQITESDSDLSSDLISTDSAQSIALPGRIFQALRQSKTSVALGFLAATLGAAGATIILDQTFDLNLGQDLSINIENSQIGDNTRIGHTTIYEGDPPEVRQRKVNQNRALIVDNILQNLNHLDSRLAVVDTTFDIEQTDPLLPGIRQGVASTLAKEFGADYRYKVALEQIEILKANFNQYSLETNIDSALLSILQVSEAPPEKISQFYNSVAEVHDSTNRLINEITQLTGSNLNKPENIAHFQERIAVTIALIKSRSKIAYVHGLLAIAPLANSSSNIDTRLSGLQNLEPRHLIEQNQAEQLLSNEILQRKQLIRAQQVSLEDAQDLLDDNLVIQATDSWNVVVGKAIALRQLGQQERAIEAFADYGEMFSDTYPSTEQYVKTAQQFTRQVKDLNVQGGAYIYELDPAGAAINSGIQVGDIVIHYDDFKIETMDQLSQALESTHQKQSVTVTFLRLLEDGNFIKQNLQINGSSLGANLMPI